MKSIDVTPTWRSMLPALIDIARNGKTQAARDEAVLHLERMAAVADEYRDHMERQHNES